MYQWARFSSDARRGEAYIGLGLVVLIAGSWWPNAPFVTAAAIISLGATEITLARFRNKSALLPVAVLHGVAYTGLYSLFIGASLHTHSATPSVSAISLASLDLIVSTLPMAIALKRIWSSLWQSTLPRH
jgi:hypothetical protein